MKYYYIYDILYSTYVTFTLLLLIFIAIMLYFKCIIYVSQGPPLLTFNIGSVETFERNLEMAQKDLGIDPANHVPLTYVNQGDLMYACIYGTYIDYSTLSTCTHRNF